MLVSAYAFGGIPAEAVGHVLARAAPWVSEELLEEYREVPPQLLSEGKIHREKLQALVSGIASYVSAARLVKPKKQVRICRDPEDDMVLECCRAAGATVLITGDGDLLALASKLGESPGLRRLRIMTSRAYLESRSARRTKKR